MRALAVVVAALLVVGCEASKYRITVNPIEIGIEPVSTSLQLPTDVSTTVSTATPTDTPTATATATVTPSATATATATVTPTPAITTGPVQLLVEPDTLTLAAGESITVTLVLDTGGREADTVDAFLLFDTSQVWVETITPLGSGLTPLAMGVEGNTVIFAAGSLVTPVRWRVPLASVRFTALTDTTASPLSFQRAKPLRWSSAWYQGTELLP